MAPSSSSSSHPGNYTRTTILIIIIVFIGILLVAASVFLIRRRRSLPPSDPSSSTTNLTSKPGASQSTGTLITDLSHPAARITPFGSPGGETPRFRRTSNSPMRIAQRLPSGAWHFVDPQPRHGVPAGISDLDVHPSSVTSAPNNSRSRSRKEREAANDATWDKEVDLVQPPPAYYAQAPEEQSLSRDLRWEDGARQPALQESYGYGRAYI